MITTSRRGFVSIAAAITMTFALGACVSAGSHAALDRPISTEDSLLSIKFDNSSRETVDVYLIGEKREWMLGRVAPGAIARLRLPEEAFYPGSARVRLAVLAGQRMRFDVARDPRAVFAIVQSASALRSQRWTFSQGNLIALPY
jgi:hypothetical protein